MATSTKTPTTVSVIVGGTSWVPNPPTAANLQTNDANYDAIAGATKNVAIGQLNCGAFGFDASLPSGCAVSQVDVNYRAKVSTTSSVANLGVAPKISATTGTKVQNIAEPTTDTLISGTAVARPGGGSWTRADLLDAVFTVQLYADQGNSATSVTYSFGYLEVVVTYSGPWTLSGTGSPAAPSGTGTGLAVTNPTYTLSGSGAVARPSGTGAGLTFTGAAGSTLSGSGAVARASGSGTGLTVTAPVYTLSGSGAAARPSGTGAGLHVTAPVYTVSGSGALARPGGAGTGLHIMNPTYTLSGTGSPARPSGTGAGLVYVAPGAVVLSGSGALARGSSSGAGLAVTAPVYTLTGIGTLGALASSGAGLLVSEPAAVYTLSGEGRLARPSALTGNEGRPTSAGGAEFAAAGGDVSLAGVGGAAEFVTAGGGARWR